MTLLTFSGSASFASYWNKKGILDAGPTAYLDLLKDIRNTIFIFFQIWCDCSSLSFHCKAATYITKQVWMSLSAVLLSASLASCITIHVNLDYFYIFWPGDNKTKDKLKLRVKHKTAK